MSGGGNTEVKVFAQSAKMCMHFGKTGAAFKNQFFCVVGDELQQHAAEIIFLNQSSQKTTLRRGKCNGLLKQRGILRVPANGRRWK